MKKEYRSNTDSMLVSFEAGRVCDYSGDPMPYWTCSVAYTWSTHMHAYWVYSVQVFGFGVVEQRTTHETEMASLREVHRYLRYLKDMEDCCKKVYGE